MKRLIEKAVGEYNMVTAGERVMCCLSGGADSVAMTHALLELSDKWGIELCAAHLNHLIRGDEAFRDEQFARSFCDKLKIPFYSERIDVPKYAREHKLGIEEAARAVRYDFFARAADALDAQKAATAHTADDNLETVLFNLARGSGIDGLCGIPPVRGNFIRPLIFAERRDVERYIRDNGLDYVTDSTNLSGEYTRNKIRRTVIPVLREINPNAAAAASRTSSLLRNDARYIDQTARQFVESSLEVRGGSVAFDRAALNGIDKSVAGRAVKKAYARVSSGKSLAYAHIEKILALSSARGVYKVSLPDKITCGIDDKNTEFYFRGAKSQPVRIGAAVLKIPGITPVPNGNFSVECIECQNIENFQKSSNTFIVDCDKITSPVVVRSRLPGDRLALASGNGTKTLKKIMNEKKIPLKLRESIPVIADVDGVVAVFGMGCDRRRAADSATARHLCIIIRGDLE